MGLITAGQQCHTWGRGPCHLIGWHNEEMHSVCACACVHACVHVCVHACVHACVHVDVCIV